MNLQTPSSSEFDRFHSHTDKPLRVHMEGVLNGTRFRSAPFSAARMAEVAALFHDLGKLNPNFQPKVKPDFQPDSEVLNREYSRHAYLSAYAFLCFCARNSHREILGLNDADIWRVLALIAHHHGHLPNFDAVLSHKECAETLAFLATNPPLPASGFLTQWLAHAPFDVLDTANDHLFNCEKFRGLDRTRREKFVAHRLDYFLETQFGFASLIESDKRDAGNNSFLHRELQMEWAKDNFKTCLKDRFNELGKSEYSKQPLNVLRTQMRDEAVTKLREEFKKRTQTGKTPRTFALTAPTGAGKTFALIALADVIREYSPSHAVVYGLPFLTITEQVEGICREIFGDEFVSRFDSRTQNPRLDELQAKLDATPQEERSDAARALLAEAFSSETFDAAFTVTTFVQIFETLLSNRNATLLKLPNFSKTIFLLDEIQALPPRLYVFFAAFLQAFCKKFDSYAIFSTATMPAFEIAEEAVLAHQLFCEYSAPVELLDLKHFNDKIFDRYEVRPLQPSVVDSEELSQKIIDANASCLVVLNTIADSKNIYHLLSKNANAEVILLNTHFTLRDRQKKIARCKELLKEKNRVILVSTQLIEAGVDIDFPVVFRDLCPLPSLIQTAGRCNRNGEHERGLVWFFELKENDKSRAELIYKSEPLWFLNFSRTEILATDGFRESELLPIQKKYFSKVGADLMLGNHRLKIGDDWEEANLVEQIDALAFASVGSFRLIDKEYGEEFRYYIPPSEDDRAFCKLEELVDAQAQAKHAAKGKLSFEENKSWSLKIDTQLRLMAPHVVQFRVPRSAKTPSAAPLKILRDDDNTREVYGLRCLFYSGDYSSVLGIDLKGNATVLL